MTVDTTTPQPTKSTLVTSTATNVQPFHGVNPTVIPLAITQSHATMWPATPATCVFRTHLDTHRMEVALKHVLDTWLVLASELRLDDKLRVSAHLPGPGVGWSTATSAASIDTVLPQQLGGRVFDTSAGSADALCPAPTVQLRPLLIPAATLVAQLTTFVDGSVVAVRASHAIVDAHAMMLFMRDWIGAYAALAAGETPVIPERKFDGSFVDTHANGEGPPPPLPGMRYDKAITNEYSIPFLVLPTAEPLDGLTAPPWETWRWQEPCVERTVRLSPADVVKIHGNQKVTTLDAVLGWFWKLIGRARDLPAGTDISLHTCIGLRGRLGLGESYAGAVVIVTSSTVPTGVEDTSYAAAIRASVAAHTTEAVSRELGRMATHADPVREWNFFFGEHNTHTSSWLRTGSYDMAITPEWVQSGFPSFDGLVIVLEDKEKGAMNVQLRLRDEVMGRLLEDPELLAL